MNEKTQTIDVGAFRPRYCVWELTLACNLRCGHCGSRAGKARPDELSTEECLGVVRSLAGLGCEVITLSGGEPTLRDDWYEIACEIRRMGMIPNMVSNGFALDDTMIARMKQVPLANVAISIDGPEDVHTEIRGKGSFQKACDSLKRLKDHGISTTVMSTINTLNLSRLEELYDLAVELGADRWRSQLGKPMGNLEQHDDWVIKPRDLLKLLPRLSALNEKGKIRVGIGDSIGYSGPYDSELRAVNWKGTPQRWSGCQAGMQAIGIEANGGVKGCLSMQAFSGDGDPFLEGNVRERSLEDIWRDPQAFAYNRQFSVKNLTGFCKKCGHRVTCRGGARCVAAATTGNISEDPYCFYRVSALATRWPAPFLRRHAASAAAVTSMLLLGASPCEPQTDYGVEPPSPTPIDCSDVCCECDYGQLPDGVWEECCAVQPEYGVEPSIHPDYGVEPTVQPDYGVEPSIAPDYGVEVTPVEPSIAPEYGTEPIDCSEVCCMCDYGVLPPEVAKECCDVADPDYGVEPSIAPDYGVEVTPVEPSIAPDYGVEVTPVDCKDVCCDCDYGELPPGVAEACCRDNKAVPPSAKE